jgi:hypothetical protein
MKITIRSMRQVVVAHDHHGRRRLRRASLGRCRMSSSSFGSVCVHSSHPSNVSVCGVLGSVCWRCHRTGNTATDRCFFSCDHLFAVAESTTQRRRRRRRRQCVPLAVHYSPFAITSLSYRFGALALAGAGHSDTNYRHPPPPPHRYRLQRFFFFFFFFF